MINFGQPYIVVVDGDYGGRRELYLEHRHDGRDLDMQYAERTLNHIYDLWQHPVHLETRQGEKPCVLTCDGSQVVRAFI